MVSFSLRKLLPGRNGSSSSAPPPSSFGAYGGAQQWAPDARSSGVELARRMFRTFYSKEHGQWCSPSNEEGTIDARHGYTVWPVSIAVWALANAVKRSGAMRADVAALSEAFSGMEKHWHPDEKGYCAWVMFPGNTDIYFDDNVHCGNALVTAYEATGDHRYLSRAIDIVTGILRKGWDRDGSGPGAGGVAWRLGDMRTRNACSTLSAAVLAARLALLDVERDYCTDMVLSCVAFSEKHLIDPQDGLVLDSWHADGDGENAPWTHDTRKFTYNTGFGVHAYALLSRLTGDASFAQRGLDMARAAISSESALMDKTLPDPEQRMWWDCVFFAHHLSDGLAILSQTATEGPPEQAAAAFELAAFVRRVGTWCSEFVVDESDGLAFRQLKPWLVDEVRTHKFNAHFGMDVGCEFDNGEREVGEGPPQSRKLIKTVIASAAVANILMYAGDCGGA